MTSVVYFIQAADGLVKIGWTADLPRRVNNLASASSGAITVLATTSGGRSLEAHLHERFAASRAHGEWFQPSAELNSLIKLIQSGSTDIFPAGLAEETPIGRPDGLLSRATEASRFARRLLDLEIEQGLTAREGVTRLASRLHVATGAITALLYRAPDNVTADLYFGLRGLLADQLGAKLERLRSELAAVRHRQFSDLSPEDLVEIDAEVARLRAKIAAFREASDA